MEIRIQKSNKSGLTSSSINRTLVLKMPRTSQMTILQELWMINETWQHLTTTIPERASQTYIRRTSWKLTRIHRSTCMQPVSNQEFALLMHKKVMNRWRWTRSAPAKSAWWIKSYASVISENMQSAAKTTITLWTNSVPLTVWGTRSATMLIFHQSHKNETTQTTSRR